MIERNAALLALSAVLIAEPDRNPKRPTGKRSVHGVAVGAGRRRGTRKEN
jgi:hypothetical protein